MPTYTTTADPVSGEFNIELPAALVGGEKVKVTAQKNGQTRSLNLQAPSEPYLPPDGGSGGENGSGSGGEGGNSTDGSNGLIVSDDGKFAITTNLPLNRAIAAAVYDAYDSGGGESLDPMRFNRGATIRFSNGIYYIKPSIRPGEAATSGTKMYFAIRVKKSDLYAANPDEKIVQVGVEGYFDMGSGYPSSDEYFDNENYEYNGNASLLFYSASEASNGSSDNEYIYIPITLYFSVENGSYNFHYYEYTTGNKIYQKRQCKHSVFGNIFKTQLDV